VHWPHTLSLSDHSADEGLFVGIDGKPSRKAHISWPAPPEDVSTSCGWTWLCGSLILSPQASSSHTFSAYFPQEACQRLPGPIPALRPANQRFTRALCSKYTPRYLSKFLNPCHFHSILFNLLRPPLLPPTTLCAS
jgi:hypothetical protein